MTYQNQLTPSQREAVSHIEGPLLILAGPGSGKTCVIMHRIAALIASGVKPYNICAITFTNKAAEEMRQRVSVMGIATGSHISTFHSLCVRLLRQYADKAKINSNFSVYSSADQAKCIKQAVKICELDKANFPPSKMLDAISSLKNKLVTAESFKENATEFFPKMLARIYTQYQNILTKCDALDFDDLLMKTAFLLQDNPDVCSEIANRFKFLLIDEYQDTNHAQYKIAKSLASLHSNICAAGDPDQSIYRWRGADIGNILAFEKDWPDAVVVKLEENFRSKPEILKMADKLIEKNQNRKQKKLIPTKPPAADVAITEFEDEAEEADGIAQKIRQLVEQGISVRDIAVFYRVNSMSRTIEEAFIENQIPYQIVRGTEFYNRKEIRDLLAYLKVLVNPNDQTALLRIINTPTRGIGKTTIDRINVYAVAHNISFFEALGKVKDIESLSAAPKAKVAVFVNMLEKFQKYVSGNVKPDCNQKVAVIAERVFVESGLKKSLEVSGDTENSALENANELINAAALYDQQTEEASLLDWLQQISLFSDTDAYDASNERVSLMTLHAAKGLEFGNVFIVGLEDGLLPHERSSTDKDELEEERRLFFVGITRAKEGLYISYSRYRTIHGQMLRVVPSQFLYELGSDFIKTNSNAMQRQSEPSYTIDEIPEFFTGQAVKHEKFGYGRIKEFVDMGESSIVVVRFNTGQTKKLMVKYANLSKVDIQ